MKKKATISREILQEIMDLKSARKLELANKLLESVDELDKEIDKLLTPQTEKTSQEDLEMPDELDILDELEVF